MSTFGRVFRVTTFGESHCKGVGAIVDGVPPCMELTEADIQPQLTRRRPGQSKLTTPRDEKDQVSILSGGLYRCVKRATQAAVMVSRHGDGQNAWDSDRLVRAEPECAAERL